MHHHRLALFTCAVALTTFGATAPAASPVIRSTNGMVTHNSLKPTGVLRSPYRHVPDEMLVKFRDSSSEFSRTVTHLQLGTRVIKEFKAVKGLQLVRLPRGMTQLQAIRAFGRDNGVLYVEPNYIINSFATPNDTHFNQLWALHNTGQAGGTTDSDIDAPEAWDLTTGNRDAVIAVIDTGIDYTHPDLLANMYRNTADCDADGVDDDGNGYIDDCHGIDTVNNDSDPTDDNGHGTHVAGTIGAAGNNAVGVTGINWSASILACKFLDASGSGTTAGAVACLDYIAAMKDRGINIVASNNSWGGGGYSQALYDAIDAQRQRGVLFVAAAGNNALDNEVLQTYPCSYNIPNIICVASTSFNDNLSAFSNIGKHVVHLGAPGGDILSTIPVSLGAYQSLSGTSMATPHVTGVVGLIHAMYPSSDWRAVKNRVLAGGDTRSCSSQWCLNETTITGKRLNAYGALTCTNSVVRGRLRPLTSSSLGTTFSAAPGAPIQLSALHINCANPNGNIVVNVSPTNEAITLLDNGLGEDMVASDGIYSASWTPPSGGTFILGFPDGDNVTISVDPDLQPGFPVKTWHDGGTFHAGPAIHTLVANIDNNPGLEIMVSGLAIGPLYAWHASGSPVSGWPIETQGVAYPVAGELSPSNAGSEVFAATWGTPDLLAYTGSATPLPGWPRQSAGYVATPPSLADVDGDGIDEIFLEEEDYALHAYKYDGSVLVGWPAQQFIGGQERHTPAIGDLDGDGVPEIVTASGTTSPGSTLFAYHRNGTAVAGFPITFPGGFGADAFPVIGDVDGDEQPEIMVVGTIGSTAVVHVVGNDGSVERSIPLYGMYSYTAVPALADMDGDGIPEIIVQTNEALNVVRGNGANYPGWPVVWGSGFWTVSAPVVGDVDGDGAPDVVVTTQYAGINVGLVRAYRRNGTSLPQFPKQPAIGGGAAPAIADIDGDGRNEIIITGDFWNGHPGYYDKVWVYDLGGPAHGPILWGQFMGNAKHTGKYTAPSAPIPPAVHYTLNVTTSGNGGVTSNPNGINCGTSGNNCTAVFQGVITVSATAAAGYRFNGWSGGACSGTNVTCTIAMDANKSVTAEFVPILYTLTVSRTGSGNGTVTSTPSGISCGATCSTTFSPNTTITLTSIAANDSTFGGWAGSCVGTGVCAITLNADTTLSATFYVTQSGGGNSSGGNGGGGGGGGCTIGNSHSSDITLAALLLLALFKFGASQVKSGQRRQHTRVSAT